MTSKRHEYFTRRSHDGHPDGQRRYYARRQRSRFTSGPVRFKRLNRREFAATARRAPCLRQPHTLGGARPPSLLSQKEPSMRSTLSTRFVLTILAVCLLAVPTLARAERVQATLSGYQEVPAVSTPASGE